MFTVRTKIAPSQIHGLGTFADEFIPRGSTIWVYHPGFDVEFSLDDLEELPPFVRENVMRYSYVSKETGKAILCADDARFMNHSSQPNTESRVDDRGYESTVASRDIAVGEEITCDYYDFDADAARKLGAATPARVR
jgi:SET domain-containing protein